MADEMNPSAAISLARQMVSGHLQEIARELLLWRDTAILPNGRLREVAAVLAGVFTHDALRIAEGLARDAALEVIANSGGENG